MEYSIAAKKIWKEKRVQYIEGLESPSEAQQLFALLFKKPNRTPLENKNMAWLVKAERAADRAADRMRQNIKFDNKNYCETLVCDRIRSMPEVFGRGSDFVNDVTCVALNRITPRYIREPIYLFFHITDSEWETINAEVAEAVDFAVHHIEKNLRSAGNRNQANLAHPLYCGVARCLNRVLRSTAP